MLETIMSLGSSLIRVHSVCLDEKKLTGVFYYMHRCKSRHYFQECVHFYFTGDSVLHLATRAENEKAAIFLATNGARAGLSNHKV